MKPRLIILSDVWGKAKNDWLAFYNQQLEQTYELTYYDCRELGEIDMNTQTEELLHSDFVNGGIDKAVYNLLKSETGEISVLAFSIGGTIAWKAGLLGLKIKRLYAVSSTRLRYESQKPDCEIKLFFGDHDQYRPNSDWFNSQRVQHTLIDGNHLLYAKRAHSETICNELKKPAG